MRDETITRLNEMIALAEPYDGDAPTELYCAKKAVRILLPAVSDARGLLACAASLILAAERIEPGAP